MAKNKEKIIGNYRVLEMIAEGGFGRTYKAEHVTLGELACIKHCLRISPQDEQILINEAKAVWDLRHYSLPTMRDIFKLDDGSLALVMSYIPGLTIEQIVEKIGRLDPEHVAWITERVLNALMYMHYHGVVHGDVKPQNIIVQQESHTVVLVDFGLSMVKPSASSSSKGYTPCFSSPEEVAGSTLLPQSDFYGLGMTMIYALNGDYEYVKRKEVPDFVPDALCDFIKRLIVRDVLSRPDWKKENLCETMQDIRMKSFGRTRSNFKSIPGL